eukprot:1514724-Pleurochrysis_carterae.AAC.5
MLVALENQLSRPRDQVGTQTAPGEALESGHKRHEAENSDRNCNVTAIVKRPPGGLDTQLSTTQEHKGTTIAPRQILTAGSERQVAEHSRHKYAAIATWTQLLVAQDAQ